MVKAGKWLWSLLTGKKERSQERVVERRKWLQLPSPLPPPPPPAPPSTPKEKRRRSFSLETRRRNPEDQFGRPATVRKTSFSAIEKLAATKIQASFRSFLARKALRALKALVKLQAVVRGFLVRKQAAATIRGMHALLIVQVRTRAQRVRSIQDAHASPWREGNQTRTMMESKLQQIYDTERGLEKLAAKNRKSILLNYQNHCSVPSLSTEMNTGFSSNAQVASSQYSPSSTKTNRICHSEAIAAEGMCRNHRDCSFFPNYMANTESWKAKARSQSVPRPRNDFSDSRQSGKQRTSFDGKNLSKAAWVSSASGKEQIPWSILLDRSISNTDYYKFTGMA